MFMGTCEDTMSIGKQAVEGESNSRSGILLNSITEVQRRLDASRSSVYLMLARGELEAVKIGMRTLITESSLQDLVRALPKAKIGCNSGKAA
jgi:excisionase family DNA binding protein